MARLYLYYQYGILSMQVPVQVKVQYCTGGWRQQWRCLVPSVVQKATIWSLQLDGEVNSYV